MLQPVEMKKALPMTLHGGAVSTTTQVWETLRAVREGNIDRVMELTSARPELSTCQYNYTPPLHFAVREGHLPLVRLLLERGAYDSTYKSYPFGDTFLTIAQDREHEEVVRLLQDAASRKWRETGEIDYEQDEDEKRFDKVVQDGDIKEVEALLTRRPELARNELSSWAEGVLMMPAKMANRRLLELLIRFGAQVPPMSKWGRFYYFRHDKIAALFLEHGMSAKHTTWHHVTLLHDMAQSGDIVKARMLLDHGADINAIDEEYCSTPLGMAARWGQRSMVQFLLDRGADPNRSGAEWSKPLAWAKKKNHDKVARDLVQAGAASD